MHGYDELIRWSPIRVSIVEHVHGVHYIFLAQMWSMIPRLVNVWASSDQDPHDLK